MFGTQSEIYWDDAYMNSQVGAITRGTYSLKIVDPILFVKNFVPADYLRPNAPVFDFADMDNVAGTQLFNEVVGSLSAAFSNYTNDPDKGNRITKIQGDQIGFANSLSQAVEEGYRWKSDRGLEIVKVALQQLNMMKIQNAYLVMLRKQTPYQVLVEIHSCNNLLPEDSKQQVKITELPEWPSWEWVSMEQQILLGLSTNQLNQFNNQLHNKLHQLQKIHMKN